MSKTRFVIRARHEVEITYEVEAETFDEALETLCNKELFTEHGNNLFGPSDFVMEEHGIEITDTECYGDPGPTGRLWTQRDWDYDEEEVELSSEEIREQLEEEEMEG